MIRVNIQWPIFESICDCVIDAASVELNEAARSHVELVIVSFKHLDSSRSLFLLTILCNLLRYHRLCWAIDFDQVC